MDILLIRHGQSEADILNVHEGRADFSLTELGIKQTKLMAQRVKEEFPPEFIWCSTLKRAHQTADILQHEIGCPLQSHTDLMEFNNGVLAGLPFREAKKKYPEPPEGRKPHVRIEGGESDIEFRARAESIFSYILSNSEYKRIAIVAHGGMISKLLQSFLKLPLSNDYGFYTGDTGIHLLNIGSQRRIVKFLNSTEHIRSLDEGI
jgi:2,3-bisphosphoglycerate-dependent phosphoglycerate mutase